MALMVEYSEVGDWWHQVVENSENFKVRGITCLIHLVGEGRPTLGIVSPEISSLELL